MRHLPLVSDATLRRALDLPPPAPFVYVPRNMALFLSARRLGKQSMQMAWLEYEMSRAVVGIAGMVDTFRNLRHCAREVVHEMDARSFARSIQYAMREYEELGWVTAMPGAPALEFLTSAEKGTP